MTQDDVFRLIGRLVVDNEAAKVRIFELETELARKANVVKMQPKAVDDPPADPPDPPEEKEPATDTLPNQ